MSEKRVLTGKAFKYSLMQDDEGVWYLIPMDRRARFRQLSDRISHDGGLSRSLQLEWRKFKACRLAGNIEDLCFANPEFVPTAQSNFKLKSKSIGRGNNFVT